MCANTMGRNAQYVRTRFFNDSTVSDIRYAELVADAIRADRFETWRERKQTGEEVYSEARSVLRLRDMPR